MAEKGRVIRQRPGTLMNFIEASISSATETDCIIWPFIMKNGGYPSVKQRGRSVAVNRLVCRLVHGDPPDEKYHAAHGCGNKRCVNPKHISWKTKAENEADKILHGTQSRGETHGQSKLTETQVREIFSLKGKVEAIEIASLFGVSPPTVSFIHNRKTWAWLDL